MAFFGAELRPGFSLVAETLHLTDRLRAATLCLTGEGQMDGQTAHGKTVAGVAALCQSMGVPCVALVGSIGEGAEACLQHGVTSYFSVCPRPLTLAEAMLDAGELLKDTAARVLRLFSYPRH